MALVQAEMSHVWKSVVSPEEMADGMMFCDRVCEQGWGLLVFVKDQRGVIEDWWDETQTSLRQPFRPDICEPFELSLHMECSLYDSTTISFSVAAFHISINSTLGGGENVVGS